MARRRGTKSSIALPWEGRGSIFGGLEGRARWPVLVGAAVVLFVGWRVVEAFGERGRVRSTELLVREVQTALSHYRRDHGRCPSSVEELVHPVRGRQQYLRETPIDAWGQPLFVRCPGHFDPDGADVVSAGPDGDFFDDENIR